GVENCDLACAFQTIRPHHPNVHPRDRENTRAAVGRLSDRTDALVKIDIWIQRCSRGQKWDEMFGHADRPNTWAAAAVRNTKRLMQVQMANVGAVIARTAKAALRIHIGAVHVNLAAV